MDQLINDLTHLSLSSLIAIIGCTTGVLTAIAGMFSPQTTDKNVNLSIQISPTSQIQQEQPLVVQTNNTAKRTFSVISWMSFIIAGFCFIISLPLITPPSPTDQAKTIIQNFYDSINKKDYQAAYNLTKDGFSQNYEQFEAGFTITEHDEISFNATKQLSNGNIQVDITVKAKENWPTGTRITTYYTTYIIGQDEGTYKILQGQTTQQP